MSFTLDNIADSDASLDQNELWVYFQPSEAIEYITIQIVITKDNEWITNTS